MQRTVLLFKKLTARAKGYVRSQRIDVLNTIIISGVALSVISILSFALGFKFTTYFLHLVGTTWAVSHVIKSKTTWAKFEQMDHKIETLEQLLKTNGSIKDNNLGDDHEK